MMAFTADGQLDPELLASRDKMCNVDSGARGRVRPAFLRGHQACLCWRFDLVLVDIQHHKGSTQRS